MELAVVVGVADVGDGVLDDFLVVEISLGRDFSAQNDEVVFDQRFTSYPAVGILFETGVQHAVTDGIAYFVGMTLGYGFGREDKCHGLSGRTYLQIVIC